MSGGHRPGDGQDLSGGEALVRALADHGVTRAFGIPGTHNLEIYRHLSAHGIAHLAPRHEQAAGYAADAYARVTGLPGVALTTTGPAVLNIAAAVGQAYSDSVPLLVVSPGMPLRHPRHQTGTLHEMRDQSAALGNIAAFSHRVSSIEEIGSAVARAFTLFRTARPRPVHIEIPLDLLDTVGPAGAVRRAPAAPPHAAAPAAIRDAAAALSGALRPGIILGGGARDAFHAGRLVAEALDAVVVTTANGKGIVDEAHPLCAGVALHSPSVRKWLAQRDVVLAVGTELAESDLWGPVPALPGTLVRVDLDPAQMYAGLPADIPLVGDAQDTLSALLPLLERPDHAPATRGTHEAAELRAARDHETADRDQRWIPWLAAIRGALPDDAVITSDSAQCCYYGALPHLPITPRGRFLHPTGFGTLGYALPAAIGAKSADPARPVLALSGDGGFQFTVQELATAAQLGHPLPVVVFDNSGYGEIRDEMTARGDTPAAVDHAPVDLPALARAYGGTGAAATSPADLAALLSTALSTPGPTVITVTEETTCPPTPH
ncbi:5-guanidino-2-oxopentanoate decarboxylase [Streptomyces sp. NPDC055037]